MPARRRVVRTLATSLVAAAGSAWAAIPAYAQVGRGGWTVINLHPPGALTSAAFAADGGVQGGSYVLVSGNELACTWSGSAASMHSLHPPEAGVSRRRLPVTQARRIMETGLN